MTLAAATPTDPAAADARAFAAAEAICRRHAKSFYFCSFLLPRPKRRAAYAVYAFCRLLDDAVDEAEANGTRTEDRERSLAAFVAKLDAAYADSPVLPPPAGGRSEADDVLIAFAQTVRRYDVPKHYFLDLVRGCRMDLETTRYATWPDLEMYCYHVAGVVGLVMSGVFGLADERARVQAVQMGNAMQLTNILRDVREDFDRGRVYLPQEDLDRFGVTEADLAAGRLTENFVALMRFEIARARAFFAAGAAGLCKLTPDGSRFTAAAMAVVYAGILGAIERQNYDVFSSRAHLTTLQKLRRLPRARRLARLCPGDPVPDVFRGSPGTARFFTFPANAVPHSLDSTSARPEPMTDHAPPPRVRVPLNASDFPRSPLYASRPPESADAWHDVRSPGGYEWWYFDAEDAERDVQIVAILFQGFVFHPGYLRRHAAYLRRPTRAAPPVAADYPCAYLVVYERGKIAAQFLTQYPPAAFAASIAGPPSLAIGPNTCRPDDRGALSVHLEGAPWHLTWHGPRHRREATLRADLRFVPRLVRPPHERVFLSRAMTGAEHHWVLANPTCDVAGSVELPGTAGGPARTVTFAGHGYHDHNYGTAPIGPGLRRWIWGRAMFDDRVITFHSARPRDDCMPDETHVIVAGTDGADVCEGVVADVCWDRRTALNLSYPSSVRLGDVMTLDGPRIVDSSPFYLRLTYAARTPAGVGRAFCEVAYPHRLRWPVLGRMIGMSIDRVPPA